jgi:hypothetical protein
LILTNHMAPFYHYYTFINFDIRLTSGDSDNTPIKPRLYCVCRHSKYCHNARIQNGSFFHQISLSISATTCLKLFLFSINNWQLCMANSWLITGFVTRLTRRVPLAKQELLILQEHPSSPPVFIVVRVTRSLVLCVCYVDRCLAFYTFSFGHCVVCSFSIYGVWLPLWYLQILLK